MLLHEDIDFVTPDKWASCVHHTKKEEEKYILVDDRVDELFDGDDTLRFTITNESSSEEDEFHQNEEGMLFFV